MSSMGEPHKYELKNEETKECILHISFYKKIGNRPNTVLKYRDVYSNRRDHCQPRQ